MPGWSLEGTLLIACNCDYGCPCNFNAPPTYGDCEGLWSWHIASGHFDDTTLDEIAFAQIGDYPGAIHEGDGVAVRFIDERADDEQRAALTMLLTGDRGGPWAIFAKTLSEVHGPHTAAIEAKIDGVKSTLRIEPAVELAMTTIKNPVTGAEVHPGAVLPEGLVCKEMRFGASETFRVSGEVEWDHSGKYVAAAPFSYTGD